MDTPLNPAKVPRKKLKRVLKKKVSSSLHNSSQRQYQKKLKSAINVSLNASVNLRSLQTNNRSLANRVEKLKEELRMAHDLHINLLRRNHKLSEKILEQDRLMPSIIEHEVNIRVQAKMETMQEELTKLLFQATESAAILTNLTAQCIPSPSSRKSSLNSLLKARSTLRSLTLSDRSKELSLLGSLNDSGLLDGDRHNSDAIFDRRVEMDPVVAEDLSDDGNRSVQDYGVAQEMSVVLESSFTEGLPTSPMPAIQDSQVSPVQKSPELPPSPRATSQIPVSVREPNHMTDCGLSKLSPELPSTSRVRAEATLSGKQSVRQGTKTSNIENVSCASSKTSRVMRKPRRQIPFKQAKEEKSPPLFISNEFELINRHIEMKKKMAETGAIPQPSLSSDEDLGVGQGVEKTSYNLQDMELTQMLDSTSELTIGFPSEAHDGRIIIPQQAVTYPDEIIKESGTTAKSPSSSELVSSSQGCTSNKADNVNDRSRQRSRSRQGSICTVDEPDMANARSRQTSRSRQGNTSTNDDPDKANARSRQRHESSSNSDDQGASCPDAATVPSAVTMRVSKGAFVFATGRKGADGSRQDVPAPTRARSKPKKMSKVEDFVRTTSDNEQAKTIFDFHDKTPKSLQPSQPNMSVFSISADESGFGIDPHGTLGCYRQAALQQTRNLTERQEGTSPVEESPRSRSRDSKIRSRGRSRLKIGSDSEENSGNDSQNKPLKTAASDKAKSISQSNNSSKVSCGENLRTNSNDEMEADDLSNDRKSLKNTKKGVSRSKDPQGESPRKKRKNDVGEHQKDFEASDNIDKQTECSGEAPFKKSTKTREKERDIASSETEKATIYDDDGGNVDNHINRPVTSLLGGHAYSAPLKDSPEQKTRYRTRSQSRGRGRSKSKGRDVSPESARKNVSKSETSLTSPDRGRGRSRSRHMEGKDTQGNSDTCNNDENSFVKQIDFTILNKQKIRTLGASETTVEMDDTLSPVACEVDSVDNEAKKVRSRSITHKLNDEEEMKEDEHIARHTLIKSSSNKTIENASSSNIKTKSIRPTEKENRSRSPIVRSSKDTELSDRVASPLSENIKKVAKPSKPGPKRGILKGVMRQASPRSCKKGTGKQIVSVDQSSPHNLENESSTVAGLPMDGAKVSKDNSIDSKKIHDRVREPQRTVKPSDGSPLKSGQDGITVSTSASTSHPSTSLLGGRAYSAPLKDSPELKTRYRTRSQSRGRGRSKSKGRDVSPESAKKIVSKSETSLTSPPKSRGRSRSRHKEGKNTDRVSKKSSSAKQKIVFPSLDGENNDATNASEMSDAESENTVSHDEHEPNIEINEVYSVGDAHKRCTTKVKEGKPSAENAHSKGCKPDKNKKTSADHTNNRTVVSTGRENNRSRSPVTRSDKDTDSSAHATSPTLSSLKMAVRSPKQSSRTAVKGVAAHASSGSHNFKVNDQTKVEKKSMVDQQHHFEDSGGRRSSAKEVEATVLHANKPTCVAAEITNNETFEVNNDEKSTKTRKQLVETPINSKQQDDDCAAVEEITKPEYSNHKQSSPHKTLMKLAKKGRKMQEQSTTQKTGKTQLSSEKKDSDKSKEGEDMLTSSSKVIAQFDNKHPTSTAKDQESSSLQDTDGDSQLKERDLDTVPEDSVLDISCVGHEDQAMRPASTDMMRLPKVSKIIKTNPNQMFNFSSDSGSDSSSQDSRKTKRRAATKTNYAEPAIHCKLRRGDPFTSSIYNSPKFKAKDKKLQRDILGSLHNMGFKKDSVNNS